MRKVYIVIRGMDYEGSSPEEVFTSNKKALAYIERMHPEFEIYKDIGWEEWRCKSEYIYIIDMELK